MTTLDCHVLVVGAGPVGLYAAYYTGFRGLSTVVVDSVPEPGGRITVNLGPICDWGIDIVANRYLPVGTTMSTNIPGGVRGRRCYQLPGEGPRHRRGVR